MPSTQHQIEIIKINGLKYEQDIKFTKATRFENMVGFFKSKKAKTVNEEDLCSR